MDSAVASTGAAAEALTHDSRVAASVSLRPDDIPHVRAWKYAKAINDEIRRAHDAEMPHDHLQCGGPHFKPEFTDFVAKLRHGVKPVRSFIRQLQYGHSCVDHPRVPVWDIEGDTLGQFNDPSNVLLGDLATVCTSDPTLALCAFCGKQWWTLLQPKSRETATMTPSALRINPGCPHVCHFNCWLEHNEEAVLSANPSRLACPLCDSGHFGLATEAFAPIPVAATRRARIYGRIADRTIHDVVSAMHDVTMEPKSTGAGWQSATSHDIDISCRCFRDALARPSGRSWPQSSNAGPLESPAVSSLVGCYRCLGGNVCPSVHAASPVNVSPSDLVAFLRHSGSRAAGVAEDSTTDPRSMPPSRAASAGSAAESAISQDILSDAMQGRPVNMAETAELLEAALTSMPQWAAEGLAEVRAPAPPMQIVAGALESPVSGAAADADGESESCTCIDSHSSPEAHEAPVRFARRHVFHALAFAGGTPREADTSRSAVVPAPTEALDPAAIYQELQQLRADMVAQAKKHDQDAARQAEKHDQDIARLEESHGEVLSRHTEQLGVLWHSTILAPTIRQFEAVTGFFTRLFYAFKLLERQASGLSAKWTLGSKKPFYQPVISGKLVCEEPMAEQLLAHFPNTNNELFQIIEIPGKSPQQFQLKASDAAAVICRGRNDAVHAMGGYLNEHLISPSLEVVTAEVVNDAMQKLHKEICDRHKEVKRALSPFSTDDAEAGVATLLQGDGQVADAHKWLQRVEEGQRRLIKLLEDHIVGETESPTGAAAAASSSIRA